MIIEPKIRNFLCLTAHPIGCEQKVLQDVAYAQSNMNNHQGVKKALIIGSSTGYGLASRIAVGCGMHADTLGVMFEKPSSGKRTASPGYYNDQSLRKQLQADGLYAETINGDAFSDTCKKAVIDQIKQDLGQVDLIVYSLAAPRRTDSDNITWSSVLKPVGEPYVGKTLNLSNHTVITTSIEPATDAEIEATIKVMGGEDWQLWINALKSAGVIADHAITLAYSYIGPDVTAAIYRNGTIGQAKKDVYQTAQQLTDANKDIDLKAYVAINKALVTQASAAIPSVSLYISILYKLMKKAGTHEGCIEQMVRLFKDKLYRDQPQLDEHGWIRMDDWEMDPTLQNQIADIWARIDSNNIQTYADIDGYWLDFYQMFGFKVPGVDYDADVSDY